MHQQKWYTKSSSIFLFSLLIGVVVLGSIYLPILFRFFPGQPASSSSSSQPLQRPNRDPSTLLCIGSLGEKSADVFVLFSMNPANDQISVVDLPPQTLSTVEERTDTLSGMYDYAGALLAVDAVEAACGIPVDYYLVLDSSAIASILQKIGPAEVFLPEEISYRNDDYAFEISIGSGLQQIDGQRFVSLLYYHRMTDQRLSGLSRESEILTAWINQRLTPSLLEEADSIVTSLLNSSEGNLSMADYLPAKDTLSYFAALENPAQSIPTEGAYSSDGSEFYLEENFLSRLSSLIATAPQT